MFLGCCLLSFVFIFIHIVKTLNSLLTISFQDIACLVANFTLHFLFLEQGMKQLILWVRIDWSTTINFTIRCCHSHLTIMYRVMNSNNKAPKLHVFTFLIRVWFLSIHKNLHVQTDTFQNYNINFSYIIYCL